jgi:signal transduction histidine kinase
MAGRVSADSWEFSPPASARQTAELAPLTHALENALQRLERSFTQQRTFVSDAAHELKTAVAVVKSSLQLLGMRERTPEEYRAGNERALADTARIEELVAKMLTLARAESAAPNPSGDSQSDLSPSIAQTVAELETFAAARQVALTLSNSHADACTIPLSSEDCRLVISNLLMNAIQHSPANAQVELRATTQNGYVEISVQDHGDGIDPAALPHVFDRFYRGDPSRARATGGAGLGLAICKAVIEKSGGTITLASEAGCGTTATVRVPNASR